MQQGVARSTEPASPRSIQPALLLLEKTPILLETLLRDLPDEFMLWKPAAHRWSIAKVLGHLAELDLVYADRTRRIVTEEVPVLQKYDPFAATVVVGDYSRSSATENLAFFMKTRRSTVNLLRSIAPESADRKATHSELGIITLHQMINEWASRDLGHVRQIAELYRGQAFQPNAGPFQKYSTPQP
jgi:DinB superfamily